GTACCVCARTSPRPKPLGERRAPTRNPILRRTLNPASSTTEGKEESPAGDRLRCLGGWGSARIPSTLWGILAPDGEASGLRLWRCRIFDSHDPFPAGPSSCL